MIGGEGKEKREHQASSSSSRGRDGPHATGCACEPPRHGRGCEYVQRSKQTNEKREHCNAPLAPRVPIRFATAARDGPRGRRAGRARGRGGGERERRRRRGRADRPAHARRPATPEEGRGGGGGGEENSTTEKEKTQSETERAREREMKEAHCGPIFFRRCSRHTGVTRNAIAPRCTARFRSSRVREANRIQTTKPTSADSKSGTQTSRLRHPPPPIHTRAHAHAHAHNTTSRSRGESRGLREGNRESNPIFRLPAVRRRGHVYMWNEGRQTRKKN